jgi:hypothetical protein
VLSWPGWARALAEASRLPAAIAIWRAGRVVSAALVLAALLLLLLS